MVFYIQISLLAFFVAVGGKLRRIIYMKRTVLKTDEEIAAAKESAAVMLCQLYDKIIALSDNTVPLYDFVEDYFFQDIDYQMLQPNIPMWVADAGRSPESPCSKSYYDGLRKTCNDPLTNRIIHWFDVQNLLAAFQDRICALIPYLKDIFKEIPPCCLYNDVDYTNVSRMINPTSDRIHTSINNVFVSMASAFDLFTKVVYECAKYDPNGFDTYKRLKSRANSVLYAKKNNGFDELKESGLLYDEPASIRTICSFRDEFIHCGSWDHRCAIYYPYIDGIPVEPFIPMPDVEPTGVLTSSGSRNKFYATGAKINTVMPMLVDDAIEILLKTENRLEEVLKAKTNPVPDVERQKAVDVYMGKVTKNFAKQFKVTVKVNL